MIIGVFRCEASLCEESLWGAASGIWCSIYIVLLYLLSIHPLSTYPFLHPLFTPLWYPPLYNLPHPFLQLVQLNRWAPHSHSILLYLLSAAPFCIPSQHPFFTQYPPPIYIYPPYGSSPFDTPSLYSQSILLSTVPLYNPLLQLVVPLGTRQPLHMTKCHLMLHLHSPSLFIPSAFCNL